MPDPRRVPPALVLEGERVMRLCNACRYCEGFCAVFPALERRLTFGEADLEYLANLCHNCGECYYACQYAPPHEFELNFPRTLAQIRAATYEKHAWPAASSSLFRRGGLFTAVASALCVAALLVGVALGSPAALLAAHPVAAGSFHALIGHRAMVLLFGLVGLGAAVAILAGAARFWRAMGETAASFAPHAAGQAALDSLRLRYLDGGGDGCSYPGEVPSQSRRWFHHLTFYGFFLCFASTTVAAGYHYLLGWHAPYPVTSLPVLLGVAGGAGLLVGPAGLLWLKARRDPMLAESRQNGMDVGFLVLLFLVALTGLLLLVLREAPAMGALLVVHLGLVLALFLGMPYGKFVHGVYRFAALARYALERRRPGPKLGSE